MSGKFENLLNLALETPMEERIQTGNLNVGFEEKAKTWELIVKYHGDLGRLGELGIQVEELIAGYAILTVPENLVELLSGMEEIEYVEKPKRYYYQQVSPREDSCVNPVTLRGPMLTGKGVLIAIIDSGIDYRRPEFIEPFGRRENESRILYLWDQTMEPDANKGWFPPEGFKEGVEFRKNAIDEVLRNEGGGRSESQIPSFDVSGHGTAVAGIAAGNGGEEGITYTGIAPEAGLLIVKLGVPKEEGFPRTTEIMRGVTYGVRKGMELNMPLVINLSFGNTYGAHDGGSLLERFLDNASEIGRTVICVGSGNEGSSAGHVADNIEDRRQIEWAVGEYERNLSVQLWKNYSDTFRIRLQAPGGANAELSPDVNAGKYIIEIENTKVLVYQGKPTPYAVAQEIYFEFIPRNNSYITSGIWSLELEPIKIVSGQYYLYLPAQGARSSRSNFFRPTPDVTLTIPSTANKVITVGAYDSTYDSYAEFSGRGYVDSERTVGIVAAGLGKPDLVAPGVGIVAPSLGTPGSDQRGMGGGGGYQSFTGTSFATPIVSGAAALLMEWGIVRGNDPYLYGEKVKAYLRAGAKPLRGENNYPNEKVGWGALCVEDSLPI